MNRRQGVEARNRTLFGKPADWEDGRLKSYKKKNHLLRVCTPGSFIEQRWGEGGGEEAKPKGQ